MKPFKLLLLAAMSLLLMANSCDDDPDPEPEPEPEASFELVFQGYYRGAEFYVDFPYQSPEQDLFYEFETYKFFLGNVRLVREDDTEVLLDSLAFIDFSENHLATGKTDKTTHAGGEFKRWNAPLGNYKGVRFGVGVPEDMNTGDASPYIDDPEHPLHPSNNMNWGMGPGFIFQSLLGFADSSDNAFDEDRAGVVYHLGLNDHYIERDYTAPEHAFEIVEGEETQFIIGVDIAMMIWPYDRPEDQLDAYAVGEFHTVGEDPALIQTVRRNMEKAWFFNRIDSVQAPVVD